MAECEICFSNFSKDKFPAVINCGHSFCNKCLVRIENNCPKCNREITFRVKNYLAVSLIESAGLNIVENIRTATTELNLRIEEMADLQKIREDMEKKLEIDMKERLDEYEENLDIEFCMKRTDYIKQLEKEMEAKRSEILRDITEEKEKLLSDVERIRIAIAKNKMTEFKTEKEIRAEIFDKVKDEADREAQLIMKYRAEVQSIRDTISKLIMRRNELERQVESIRPAASAAAPVLRTDRVRQLYRPPHRKYNT